MPVLALVQGPSGGPTSGWDTWEELRGSLCLPVPAPMAREDGFPAGSFQSCVSISWSPILTLTSCGKGGNSSEDWRAVHFQEDVALSRKDPGLAEEVENEEAARLWPG